MGKFIRALALPAIKKLMDAGLVIPGQVENRLRGALLGILAKGTNGIQ